MLYDFEGARRIGQIRDQLGGPSGTCRRLTNGGGEDYNRIARLEEFLPWFKDWKFDWLDVPGLIQNCPHAYEYPLVDRDPVDRWTFGLVP